jgi:hypothetical protein
VTFYNPDFFDEAPGQVVRLAKDRARTALVYPPQGYDFTAPGEAFTVNAGEVVQEQIDLGMSVSYIQQPHAIKALGDPAKVPSASCYVVTNSNGDPIDPKEWRNYGGKVRVKINPDTVTATVTIRGAALPFSPFSIAEQTDETGFNSLRLVGTGVTIWKRTLTIDTGLTRDDTSDDSTATIDNPFMQSREQAYDAAHAAIVRRIGYFQRVTLSLSGADGIEGMDPQRPETALGRLAGARVVFDGAFYRIRSASITPSGISATSEQDTRFADFDAVMPAGLTYAQFDALHAGQTFADFDADPLAGGNLG